MGLSPPKMRNTGQGDGFGITKQEPVWDKRVSSLRTDSSVIHLEFLVLGSAGTRDCAWSEPQDRPLRPADLRCCSLDDRESPVMCFLTQQVICPSRLLWWLSQMRVERLTWVGAGGCVGVRAREGHWESGELCTRHLITIRSLYCSAGGRVRLLQGSAADQGLGTLPCC